MGPSCRFCKKLFTAWKNALRHERQCADAPNLEMHLCEKCGTTFARWGNLQRHLKICTGTHTSRSKHCRYCYRQFTRTFDARRHEDSCTGNQARAVNALCDKCGNVFARRDNLAAHRLVCRGSAATTPALPTRCTMLVSDEQQASTSRAVQPMVLPNTSTSQATSTIEPEDINNNNDFVEVARAFSGSLRTFVAGNNFDRSLDICTYLETMEDRIVAQLTEIVEATGAVKFNMWLECNYAKPAPFDDSADLRAFKTPNIPLYNVDDVAIAVRNSILNICKEEDEYMSKGSGWSLTSVKCIQLRVSKLDPLRASSYLPLPPSIAIKHAVLNPQNEDQECFKWAIISKFVGGFNVCRVDQRYLNLETQFNFDGLDFPTPVKQINVFERHNPTVSVNVYTLGEENKVVPIRVVDEEKQQHFDLLLISDVDHKHYCLITDFSRLIRSQVTNHNERIYICKRCFKSFDDQLRVTGMTGQQCLEQHRRYCVPHAPVRVEMPLPDKDGNPPRLEFTNFHHMGKLPIVVYADFEAMLTKVDSCQHDPNIAYTEKYQKHEPYSYGIYIKVDNARIPTHLTANLPQEPIIYRGVDAASRFMEDIVEIGNKVKDIYATSIPMTPLTRTQYITFNHAAQCCYCYKPFTASNYRVKDHDHFTGNYIGPSCNGCNMLRRRPKKLVVFFHNLGYDQHFIVKQLGYDTKEIFIIPHSEEKMITFSKKLANNATFGKLMEAKRKRQVMELVCCEERLRKLVARPTFKDYTVYDQSLALVHLQHEKIMFDKPIYVGFAVLDLSKTLMYHFHYDVMKPSGITVDEWPERTSERLRGPALDWWQLWGQADMEWPEFAEALNHRFNAGATLVQCTSQFYSSTQREGEPVENFIAHKLQLFRRISPLVEPARALPTITLLLRDELQPFLRIGRTTTVEDYVQLAVATEQNFQRAWWRNPRRTNREDPNPPNDRRPLAIQGAPPPQQRRPSHPDNRRPPYTLEAPQADANTAPRPPHCQLGLGQLTQPPDNLLRIPVEVNNTPAIALVDTGASHVFIHPSLVPPGSLRPHRGELRLATATHAGLMVGYADVQGAREAGRHTCHPKNARRYSASCTTTTLQATRGQTKPRERSHNTTTGQGWQGTSGNTCANAKNVKCVKHADGTANNNNNPANQHRHSRPSR
ncbi:uncharacterized protein LOC134542708 [Bacillus rossius redtenbacheri]|uniref:uncharacterized protein LOC134542708 n=1 Tax=Bacillus rossius redtenbacheri TaxID=93214 RepID=UPI002FDE989C